jgi:L-lysine exporter family protein LysE/ArgO
MIIEHDEALLHRRKKNKFRLWKPARQESAMSSILSPFASGFFLSAALIMALGAQNLFVLRQGLRREHVGVIVLFCGFADALLIAAGVGGVGAFLAAVPQLTTALAFGGAAFLVWYGVKALRRTAAADAMVIGDAERMTLGRALTATAAFTFLNPHVYLDTVLLMGAAGSSLPVGVRPIFVAGAATASFTWFAALGYGARLLKSVFVRPVAWRMLDAFVGVVMLALAASLIGRALSALP